MIDTHAHLYDVQFDGDRGEMIARAVECGVECALLPNIDRDTIRPMFDMCRDYPHFCFPMLGLHPTSVGTDFEQQLDEIHAYLGNRHVAAIGEIGVDLYWDRQYKEQQIEAFRIQVGWAKRYGLPVVIHCRKSYDEIISVLRAEQDGSLSGVFHCFPGNIRQAEEVTGLGFMLGIGGVATYKNAEMAAVAAHVGIEHILTETDAPYLPPVPFRGKRNESAYILYIVQKIAELKNVPAEEVARLTAGNARRIFPKIIQNMQKN
jgi:TatD DNase family protein